MNRIFIIITLGLSLYACDKVENRREFTGVADNDSTIKCSNDELMGSITDIEGNIYKTVVIGSQVWMAENLRTTKFNDGSPIPFVQVGTQWVKLSTPGYCWYGNDESSNKDKYGALYNWYAAGSGKLAPEGWHVATQDDWTALISYLGGEEKAGGRMKESGIQYWNSPNSEASNTSGFSARAGGGRDCFCSGTHGILEKGYWWTSTASDLNGMAFYHKLNKESGRIDNTSDIINYKVFGFSVRCVKD